MTSKVGGRSTVKTVLIAFWVLLLLVIVVGTIQEGSARRDLNSDRAVHGTFTLERRVTYSAGKPPLTFGWSGQFQSDDGLIHRQVEAGETLPGDNADRRRSSGGWSPGDTVRVVWNDQMSDRVFLEEGSRAWRNWVEGTLVLVVGLGGLGAVLLAVRRWERRHGPINWSGPIEDPPPAPKPPSQPTEIEQLRERLAKGQQEQARLERELKSFDSGNGSSH